MLFIQFIHFSVISNRHCAVVPRPSQGSNTMESYRDRSSMPCERWHLKIVLHQSSGHYGEYSPLTHIIRSKVSKLGFRLFSKCITSEFWTLRWVLSVNTYYLNESFKKRIAILFLVYHEQMRIKVMGKLRP